MFNGSETQRSSAGLVVDLQTFRCVCVCVCVCLLQWVEATETC